MSDLIKIDVNENQEPIVNGRELYKALDISTRYNDWFPRMCEYGFKENEDYCVVYQDKKGNVLKNEYAQEMNKNQMSANGISINHAMKLDMAKEIAMLQRTDKGKEVRQYFIQVEKDFNSPEKIMARALKIAENKISVLQLENAQSKQIIGELKPKADYTDMILKNRGLVTMTAIAKDYGMTASKLNKKLNKLGVQYKQSRQWFLYKKYQDKGYTHSETVNYKHKDGRDDIAMNTKWTQKGRLFLYNLLKENGLVPVIER